MSGHVSMMNDVLISQLPPEILRATLRHIVSQVSEARSLFTDHVRGHFRASPPTVTLPNTLFPPDGSTAALEEYLKLGRCLFSCHMVQESLPYLIHLVRAIPSARAAWAADSPLERSLETSSADIVQAVQAIKEAPKRPSNLKALLLQLLEVLDECNDYCMEQGLSQPYVRTQLQVSDCLTLLYPAIYLNGHAKPKVSTSTLDVVGTANWTNGQVDKVNLGSRLRMPRMLNGFWQMSSPAWGSASGRKMDEALLDLASKGLVAADMADHYGDAELVYGSFRNRLPAAVRDQILCATKWCVFDSPQQAPTREWVLEGVMARSKRVGGTVELLQFHWQDYSNNGYLQAIEYLVELTHTRPELVTAIGLCNFDAKRTEEVCQYMVAQTGSVGIVSNQFSLIDSRPIFGMAKVCQTYGLKLLTYGSFCGGFLSDRWLDQAPPVIYDQVKPLNPSQRKYLDMIYTWGSWTDFTTLLRTLRGIAGKHNVDISNVATRWVLQRPETCSVIVGTRLGVSNNAAVNLQVFTFELSPEEIGVIEEVAFGAGREKALALYKAVGDCGQEYR